MPCAMDDDNGSLTGRILSVLPAPRVWCEPPLPSSSPPPTLLRPLAEYEAVVGGGW